MFVSVILPVFNGARDIGRQLEALSAQDDPGVWELIVVDNNSTDDTVAVVRSYGEHVPMRIITASERGTPSARNAGARVARGDLLLFCDADDVVDPGWIRAMVDAADHGGDAFGGALELDSENRGLGPRRGTTSSLPDDLGLLPFATGANCGVRRAVFEALGGFDPEFVLGANDVEFFWRIQLEGYELRFVPDAVVQYRERSDLRALTYQRYTYGRSQALLFLKFRNAGMPRQKWWTVVMDWARLMMMSPLVVVSPRRRRWWVRKGAVRVGRLAGSFRHRVLYL